MLRARKDYNERIQDSQNLISENEQVFLLKEQDALSEDAVSFDITLSQINENITEALKVHLERIKKDSNISKEDAEVLIYLGFLLA